MAVITSAATGNFSAGATWSGGVVPGAADDAIVATGHTVTIDTNTTVLSIQSSGGTFNINNGVTLTCTATDGIKGPSAGSVQTLRFTLTGNQSATIIGNVRGSTAVNVATIRLDGTGTLNITGDVSATTTLSIQGVLATSAAGRYIVTGNITGGTTSSAYGAFMNTANSRLDVTGNLNGGSASGTSAVNVQAAVTVVVVGNCTANTGSAMFHNQAGAVIDITGTITASTTFFALEFFTLATTPPIISGNIIDASNGRSAVYAANIAIRTATNGNYTDHRSSAGGSARVIRADQTYWYTGVDGLSPANVRSGTAYGTGGALTGTLAVPPANAVASGVPVDNTTGTAAVRLNDIAAVVGAQVAAALDSTP